MNWDKNCFINTAINLRPRFAWKKKNVYNNQWNAKFCFWFWCNDIWSTGLYFGENDDFAGIFANFCFIMFKSLTGKCLSYVVVNMPHNCLERTLNIIVIKSLLEQHSQRVTITMTEVVLIQVFFLTIDSKHSMEPSSYSKVSSAQKMESYFSLFWVMEFSIIFSSLDKIKFFPTTLCFLKKTFLLFPTVKCFIHSKVRAS